jgi:hypothetical protein
MIKTVMKINVNNCDAFYIMTILGPQNK